MSRARPVRFAAALHLTVLLAVGCGDANAFVADGDGPLIALDGDSSGVAFDAADSAATRVVGGMPLCTTGDPVEIVDVGPHHVEGDLRVDFVGVRHGGWAGPDEEARTVGSHAGTLDRDVYVAPQGYLVDVTCDAKPDFVEIAAQYTVTGSSGGVIEGFVVTYKHGDGEQRMLVDHTVVACGESPPRDDHAAVCDG